MPAFIIPFCMKITFVGAAGCVTGSGSFVETEKARFLVDCGMFQGSPALEARNTEAFPFDPKILSHVFVTHAHLDHVGRLPLLVKQGYTGFIYATKPTVELAKLILDDAYEIMHYDHVRHNKPLLYTEEDIATTMAQFKGVEYDTEQTFPEGLSATFHDAGHIFGSAFIEFHADGKKFVFSGDVGNVNVPILRDTASLPEGLDLLVCESTYGDRFHENKVSRQQLIENMIADGIKRGGVTMIPSFSLERTQELIYELNDLIDRQGKLPKVPIFLDSPLAIDALKVYRKYPQYYDEEAARYLQEGDDMFIFAGLTPTYSRQESMKINNTPGTKVVIAGSGMMNGGRIVHHALRYLPDPKSTLLIIGYQSEGTPGREIQDGARHVTILGERVEVNCFVQSVGALSAHGDQHKLVSWISAAKPKQVIFNHGEAHGSGAMINVMSEKGIMASAADPKNTSTF